MRYAHRRDAVARDYTTTISQGWRQGNAGAVKRPGSSEDGTTVRNPRPQDAEFCHGHGLWVAAEPVTGLVGWTAREDNGRTVFQRAYGAETSSMAQEIGSALRQPVTFR